MPARVSHRRLDLDLRGMSRPLVDRVVAQARPPAADLGLGARYCRRVAVAVEVDHSNIGEAVQYEDLKSAVRRLGPCPQSNPSSVLKVVMGRALCVFCAGIK